MHSAELMVDIVGRTVETKFITTPRIRGSLIFSFSWASGVTKQDGFKESDGGFQIVEPIRAVVLAPFDDNHRPAPVQAEQHAATGSRIDYHAVFS